MSNFTRKLLLMSTVLVPVLVGHSAHAQIPVTDAGSIAQLIQQVTTAGQQLQQLQQQYNQMVQQYNSLAKLTNMGSIEGQLLSPLNQNPMMPDASQAMAFLNGGSMAGQGQAGTNAQSLFTQNHVYTSSTPGFLGTEMTRNANSVAALMGAAQQLYATAQSRISGLSNLQAQLTSAHDPKDVLDLQARLQSEGTFIQNQQQQAQALMTVAQMQQANERERYQEQRQSDIATAIRNAQGW
jgi:type IV secretion system protein VirB5